MKSNIIKEYEKSLDSSFEKPHLSAKFFPVTSKRYIVIHNDETPSKRYRFMECLISFLKAPLLKDKIEIIQIEGQKPLTGVDYHINNRSPEQYKYIIEKCSLLISSDGLFANFANVENVPQVTIMGNTYGTSNGPSVKNSSIIIEPDWKCKPSYSEFDPNDSINSINPETIYYAALKLLSFVDIPKIESKYLGSHFSQEIIEVVPSSIAPIQGQEIYVRCDYGFNEGAFFELLSKNSCSVVSDKEIPLETLSQFKGNISKIIFQMPNKISKEYLKGIENLGMGVFLITKNEKDRIAVQSNYFDFKVILEQDCDEDLSLTESLRFFTTKCLVEGERQYFSYAHWKNKLAFNTNIINNSDFRKELKYFYVYDKDS